MNPRIQVGLDRLIDELTKPPVRAHTVLITADGITVADCKPCGGTHSTPWPDIIVSAPRNPDERAVAWWNCPDPTGAFVLVQPLDGFDFDEAAIGGAELTEKAEAAHQAAVNAALGRHPVTRGGAA